VQALAAHAKTVSIHKAKDILNDFKMDLYTNVTAKTTFWLSLVKIVDSP
jgi:hypothetical protein